MAWTPTYNTGSTAQFDQRILDYIAARQVEALAWASTTTLPPFKTISASIADRTKPVYPSLMVLESAEAEDEDAEAEGILRIAYSITFECVIASSSSAVGTIVHNAKHYALALKSLLRNIDKTTLFNISGTSAAAPQALVVGPIESSFDPLKSNETQNLFFQEFQVRATFDIYQKYII